MRYAPLFALALVSGACSRAPADRVAAEPHPLVGPWTLMRGDRPGVLRLEIRVDSVVNASAFGTLIRYMLGDAGLYGPDEWGPLTGEVLGDSVDLLVQSGPRTPALRVAGRLAADTIRIGAVQINASAMPGPWLLVRATASRP